MTKFVSFSVGVKNENYKYSKNNTLENMAFWHATCKSNSAGAVSRKGGS